MCATYGINGTILTMALTVQEIMRECLENWDIG